MILKSIESWTFKENNQFTDDHEKTCPYSMIFIDIIILCVGLI